MNKTGLSFVTLLSFCSIFISALSAELVMKTLSLDGKWEFANSEMYRLGEWDEISVPGSWNTYTPYADYIGDGWYQRIVNIPQGWKGKRIYIKFDAVYDIADVWLDKHYLGQHTGGYTPFEFEVSEYVKPGQSYQIKLKANNEHAVGAWFQWGGINRSVSMFAKEDLRLIHQKIEPTLDLVTGTAQVKLIVTVENKCDFKRYVRVVGHLDECKDVAFQVAGHIAPYSQRQLVSRITLNTDQTRPWHFDNPQLYHLTTQLSVDGEVLDQQEERFGIREIDITPDGLYLNGQKVRLMGFNRVHDHRAYGNSEPRHLVRSDIDMMKRSGANFSRIMHAPCSPELLDYCDEVGYLIWAEIPMWQKVYRVPMNNLEDAQNSIDSIPGIELREMIQRDWNHPSIIGWSPGNELRHEASLYVETMRPFVNKLDSTRHYANIHDHGFKLVSQGGSSGLKSSSVDMILMNKYGNTERKIKEVIAQRELVPNLPIFYSEFGEARSESLNHKVDFSTLWEKLGKEPYVIGGAHWTFNDYRSYFKLTPASQNRDWGAVDIWRNPKLLYHHLSKVQQPVHSLTAELGDHQATVVIQPRGKDEIPSFALRGYYWSYELMSDSGKVLDGKLFQLQDLEPGDKSVSFSVRWKDVGAKQLLLSLLSSTGYTVAESKYDLLTGEEMPLMQYPEALNPEVRKVLALDEGFMIGVTSLEGDTGLEVQYGKKSGSYLQHLSAPVFGAIRVSGLINGQIYFGRVRRLEHDAPGPWSSEFAVTPDGDLPPAAPEIFGVIEGDGQLAVRIRFAEKACAYHVELRSGKTVELNRSQPGLLLLPSDSRYLSVQGEHGRSEKVEIK